MSISPAQMIRQDSGSTDGSVAPKRPTQTDGHAPQTADFTNDSVATTPAASSPAQLSTDMRVDDHHRIYYEVVNDGTGDVVCEIPSEAIRRLGEKLILPLDEHGMGHLIDAKS